jgi:formylglycine-generating enzyme required for sulfatase activity
MEEFTFGTVRVNTRGETIDLEARRAQRDVEELGGGATLAMVVIPGGEFVMGSPRGQGYDDERPQHPVTIAPFYLGQFPITQAQWRAIMGALPLCRSHGDQRPVESVSWDRVMAFCSRLTERTGRAYGLPSEAQWEYACRAGTTTPFCYGETITTELANYCGIHTYEGGPVGPYRHQTTDVGSFPPNAFGLYDMHGGVWEWCADAWHSDYVGAPTDGRAWESGDRAWYHVARGGSWHDGPDLARSAARLRAPASGGDELMGFRVALI